MNLRFAIPILYDIYLPCLLEAGKTQAEVAAQVSIHKSTLEKWWYRWRDTGSCEALPANPGPKRKLQTAE
jgi:transposase